MNNYLFKKEKVLDLFEKIKNEFEVKKDTINKAFELDLKEWEIEIKIDEVIKIIDSFKEKEYLPIFSKDKIVDGIGKIGLISSGNTYLNLNFILSCLYTNNKVTVFLTNKLLASNKVVIECVKKVIKKEKLDEDTVEFIEVVSEDKVISYQDKFDLIYYFGNKETYLNFIKRLHVDSKFENYGEMDVFVDSKDFKTILLELDKFAYINEIKINYYKGSLENAALNMNDKNNINKISVIFTKDTAKAYEFIKKIKSENVYININPCEYIKFDTNLNNLIYSKKVVIKK